jgi:hypothetical protein
MTARLAHLVLCYCLATIVAPAVAVRAYAQAAEEKIDFAKARELMRKRQGGEKLTAEEQAYLERARKAFAAAGGQLGATFTKGEKSGLKPISDMTADDRYQGEDGGLYGGGKNTPPEEHRKAALAELAKIEPLDAQGKPAKEGKIVFLSISMSNATQEFSYFKQIADKDKEKSDKLVIVDGAQGGQAMAEWAPQDGGPWAEALRRIDRAGVSPAQVQVAWIKLANKGPRGGLKEHGGKLHDDTLAVIQNAKQKFPNLRIVYLASRIYGGYANGPLNPEPYAYESGFVARWLIQEQIKGEKPLNYDAARGDVKAPLLLWGPYLWADGTTPRGGDKLTYTRKDLAGDGTHPSQSGREKVANLLLEFVNEDELAKTWFTAKK